MSNEFFLRMMSANDGKSSIQIIPPEFLAVNCFGVNREKFIAECVYSMFVEGMAFENLGLLRFLKQIFLALNSHLWLCVTGGINSRRGGQNDWKPSQVCIDCEILIVRHLFPRKIGVECAALLDWQTDRLSDRYKNY